MHNKFNLEHERTNNKNYIPQMPFDHQFDAFDRLSNLYDFNKKSHKSGILVLPTGAGKTFTSVNWICKNAIPKGYKVLWLAHTGHLLKQAYEEFSKNILQIPPTRNTLNIRAVASSPLFGNASQIEQTDDVLIITTQTAINNFRTKATDQKGENIRTKFEDFLERAKETGLFVVIDEAHHAPAFGCRNLLIGGSKFDKGIKQIVPNSFFLGLTATPTYNDQSRKGWLWEIFSTDVEHIDLKGKKTTKKGIIYEVKKETLEKAEILAIPKYFQRNTGETFDLDDTSYERLVKEHKDLPEWLIANLAKDEKRNNFIADEYIQNKAIYGKTLIFADRWYQCVYIKEKLLKAGIKTDEVYTHIEGSLKSEEERNKKKSTNNDDIIAKFKDNQLDVLLNIRMLTEGTDVPDIDTVFITRQTTSSILLTQMIGRALRGTKAQKKDKNGKPIKIKNTANIVFFTDNWKRIINFANQESGGLSEETKVRGAYPIEYISIKLVEELSRKIDSGIVIADKPFLTYLPIGWYETEITIGMGDDLATFKEFVIVTETSKPKFEKFIQDILYNLDPEWGNENITEEFMNPYLEFWLSTYFSDDDNFATTLDLDLVKIVRHIAQSDTKPTFISFEERNSHDLSGIAYSAVVNRMNDLDLDDLLTKEYYSLEKFWQIFYKDYYRFSTAFDAERRRAIYLIKNGNEIELTISKPNIIETSRETTPEVKEKILKHDKYTCQCCGFSLDPKTKNIGKLLQIDHISAYKFSGDSSESNLQTLCTKCNSHKKINEINFRITSTKLLTPKQFDIDKTDIGINEPREIVLKRIINFFYSCKAVLNLNTSSDGNKFTKVWVIELYQGNNPEWLISYKGRLIEFIQTELNYKNITDIIIK
jgi:superfamily II DNA or RNA helicase